MKSETNYWRKQINGKTKRSGLVKKTRDEADIAAQLIVNQKKLKGKRLEKERLAEKVRFEQRLATKVMAW